MFGSSDALYGSIVYGSATGAGGGGGGTLNRSADNTITLLQQVARELTLEREISHTLTLTQSIALVRPADGENTIVFTDLAEFTKFKVLTASNTFVPLQTALCERNVNKAVYDTLSSLQQVVLLTRDITLSASSTLTLSDDATGIASKLAFSEITFTDDAEFDLAKAAHNFFDVQQFVTVELTLNRAIDQQYQPYHNLVVAKLLNPAVADTLVLTQEVIGVAVKNASDLFTITQSVNFTLTKNASNFFGLGHFADVVGTHIIRRGHLFRPVGTVGVEVSASREATSVFGMNQFAKATRIRVASASSTFVPTGHLVQEYFDASIEDNLVLSHDAVGARIIVRSVNHSLGLSQSHVLSKTLNRTINDTLAFNSSFQRLVNLGSRQVVLVSSVPSQTVTVNGNQFVLNSSDPGGYAPVSGVQYVTVQSAQAVVVRSYVILEPPGGVLVMPAPEFGDSENWTAKTNIKRTMSGARYIYKRENSSNRLSYTFVVDRLKALEARRFLLQFNSTAMRMTNFKGEIWVVVLTNSPFDLTEEGFRSTLYGNRCRMTLEFEGVRIN